MLIIGLVGVVIDKNKDGILKPRLFFGTGKKLLDSIIRIADTLVNLQGALVKFSFILFRNLKRVVGGEREDIS